MKFSIATPCFNSRTDLPRCVGSIRGQVMVKSEKLKTEKLKASDSGSAEILKGEGGPISAFQHFSVSDFSVEHLVQDGGSTDGTVEWLEENDERLNQAVPGSLFLVPGFGEKEGAELRNQEPRTKNQEPSFSFAYASGKDAGMYDAINKAWERSTGDVLSWLNADEQYLPGTLESVVHYFKSHPEADAVYGNFMIVDGEGKPLAARREIPLKKTYIANGSLYAASCTCFYRRRLWDEGVLRLDTSYRYSSDADLVLRLLDDGVKFGHIDRIQAVFGVAGGNLSFSPAMKEESDRIKKRFGMLPYAWMRKGVMAARHVEKLVRGCYRPVPARYQFALDEVPNYREVDVPSVGTRFEYDWHRPA
jgi:glycosyltransferase involved in cell wall biosynthesis